MWALMGEIHFLNGHFRLTLVICRRIYRSHYDSFEIHLMEWWQHFPWIEIKFHVSSVSTHDNFYSIILRFCLRTMGANDHHRHHLRVAITINDGKVHTQKFIGQFSKEKIINFALLKISGCFRFTLNGVDIRMRSTQNTYQSRLNERDWMECGDSMI